MSSFNSVEGASPKSIDPGPDVDRHVAGGPLRSHVGLHKPGACWSEMIRPVSDLSIMAYFIIANQQASRRLLLEKLLLENLTLCSRTIPRQAEILPN